MAAALSLSASSFSATRSERCSAEANSGFQSFFLTVAVNCSVCAGSFDSASLKRLSAASSDSTISRASSGQTLMHCGSPSQRLHAMAFPVSAWMVIPPCGQACTHQSQPLHFLSSMIKRLLTSDWVIARSGHAFTHLASWQPRQVNAKLKTGAMRTTRILLRMGFQLPSPFSVVQAYSQIPQPMHLLGSTETNFLGNVLADIIVTKPFGFSYSLCIICFYALLKKNSFLMLNPKSECFKRCCLAVGLFARLPT